MSDPTSNPNSWFAGLGNAQQGGGGNYFTAGTYLCEVIAISRKVSTDPKKKNARLVVGELKIVEVLAALPADGTYAASKAVGEVCSVVCNLDGAYPSMEMGRLKGLLEAAAGPPDGGTDDASWAAWATIATEPPGTTLAGARVIVQAGKARTKAGVAINPLTFRAPAAPAEGA